MADRFYELLEENKTTLYMCCIYGHRILPVGLAEELHEAGLVDWSRADWLRATDGPVAYVTPSERLLRSFGDLENLIAMERV